MSLHTSGVELDAPLSVSTAVLRAATWEVEAVHLCVTDSRNRESVLWVIQYSVIQYRVLTPGSEVNNL